MKGRPKKKGSVFALDIGTRSIVGLILDKDKDIRVQAVEYLEHETRSMFDGQIHDVEAVAAEIAIVKQRLEEKTGIPLTEAAVAAAGRALKTARGTAESVRVSTEEISWEEVRALELAAVQQAQLKIAEEESGRSFSGYFCVGYTVIHYFLEEQPIQNLVGQKGANMTLEVIATFLPRVVVDSLFSALRKSNLEVSSLTLEPIAALSAAIPPNMRLLNLALVDIGAGTSDIALINKGTIFGYAMVPMGGDEITEAIAEHYLLDFNTAESIKCKLTKDSSITFFDILENEITARSAEVIAEIRPAIRELANSIAVEIVAINQKSPDAVICVGGGSMTPLLLAELASALELPDRRVGVRTREALANILGDFPALTGPQAITPIGIGIIALNSHNLPLVRVAVNDHDVPLWGLNEVTVASALLASGVNLNNIYGRPGMGLTVEVNGVLKVFKGKMGTLPVIKVNGEPAGLDTPLQEGDVIEFIRGEDGVDAVVYVKDLVEESQGSVVVNDQAVRIAPLIIINGEEKGLDDPIPDRSKVELVKGNRLATVLSASGFDSSHLRQREFNYVVNGKETRFLWSSAKAYVKSKLMEIHSPVSFGDEVNCLVGSERPTLGEVLQIDEMSETVTVRVNGDIVKLPKRKVTVKMNSNPAALDDFLEDDAEIQLTETNRMIILSDVLNHISVDTRPAGKLVLRVNSEEAGFTTPLKDNDQIEISWEDLPQ